jgi:Fe-S-cluster-containing hydrogenase component 2
MESDFTAAITTRFLVSLLNIKQKADQQSKPPDCEHCPHAYTAQFPPVRKLTFKLDKFAVLYKYCCRCEAVFVGITR